MSYSREGDRQYISSCVICRVVMALSAKKTNKQDERQRVREGHHTDCFLIQKGQCGWGTVRGGARPRMSSGRGYGATRGRACKL